MGVIIKTPQLLMEIKLVLVESLFIHEETIPEALTELEYQLIEEQVLKHPMIVDKKTLVVLDGMHRVAALKNLNYRLAPVCLVDYQNPAIELFAWHREFEGRHSLTDLTQAISLNSSFNLSSTSSNQVLDLVNKREVAAALATGNQAFALKSSISFSMKRIYDEIALIESIAQKMGYRLIYSTESDAAESIKSALRPVLIVPSLTKKEVVEGALKKEIFAPKTTRHVVPARPLFVNVPLSWLKQADPIAANKKLKDYLGAKHIIKKESGAIIEGRRYEECSYLFSDSP